MTDHEDFASLLGEFEKQQNGVEWREPGIGDPVSGRVVSIQDDWIFLDLGGKAEGMLEITEVTDSDGNLTVAVGDTVPTLVSGKENESGRLILGQRHARKVHGSEELRRAFEQQIPVEGRILAETKGGVEVDIAGERAFCPASQIDTTYIEDLGSLIDQRMSFRITRFEEGRRINMVVSRRVLLEEERLAQATETRARLKPDAVLKGTVTSIKPFGAFVDLGGVEGMIHISEIAYGRLENPGEILSVGQSVEVAVLSIEATDNPRHPERIALSLRALEKDPWSEIETRYSVGDLVSGKVSRLQPFGAFVEIAPGIDGLIHISELGANHRISHPQEVVKVGEQVAATILSIDPDKRRIQLSLDQNHSTATSPPTPVEHNAASSEPARHGFSNLGDILRATLNKKT